MAKLINAGREARRGRNAGILGRTDAAQRTLGPKGRDLVLGTAWDLPTITSDDASISKQIELDDPCGKLGAEL